MRHDENKNDDDLLLEQLIASEKNFRDGLTPDPAVREQLRRRLQPVPSWKKPVPLWAAAAAVLLLIVPLLLLFSSRSEHRPEVAFRTVRDTLYVRDTVRVAVQPPEQHIPEPGPAAGGTPRGKTISTANSTAAQSALLGVYGLPQKLPVTGFTMADDTSLKKFIINL